MRSDERKRNCSSPKRNGFIYCTIYCTIGVNGLRPYKSLPHQLITPKVIYCTIHIAQYILRNTYCAIDCTILGPCPRPSPLREWEDQGVPPTLIPHPGCPGITGGRRDRRVTRGGFRGRRVRVPNMLQSEERCPSPRGGSRKVLSSHHSRHLGTVRDVGIDTFHAGGPA